MTWNRSLSALLILSVATAVVVWWVMAGGGGKEPDPIVVAGNRVTVYNGSASAWKDVEIWVNIHYRITADTIEAGQRLDAPLDAFVAGFGQRFDWRRQTVNGIELDARTSDNKKVQLIWGKGRRP